MATDLTTSEAVPTTPEDMLRLIRRAEEGDGKAVPALRKLLDNPHIVDLRKLALPVLQVNIGRKQVNIAGPAAVPTSEGVLS